MRFSLLSIARRVLVSGLLVLSGSGSVSAREAACPAYDQLRPLLNSQRIASCFGSYGVEVLKQEGYLRIANLYSLSDGGKVTRTLAISEFAETMPEDLQAIYQAIRDGASMGATLQAGGWQVDKRNRYLGELPVDEAFACLSGWPQAMEQQELALQVYDLYVQRGDERVRFALLAELHDPRYLNLQDLQALIEVPSKAANDAEIDSDTHSLLQQVSNLCALPE